MRRDDDSDAELLVHAPEQPQEGLCGKRIEHGGRLVQEEKTWPHDHERGQGKNLLLAARKLGGALPEPGVDTEEIAGLGYALAHLFLRRAQILEAEGKLVPDRIADDLALGVLEHVSDARGRLGRRECINRTSEEGDGARKPAVRCQLWLRETQKRRLARAILAGEDREGAFRHGECDVGKDIWPLLLPFRHCIGKAHVAELQSAFCHLSSFRQSIRSCTRDPMGRTASII